MVVLELRSDPSIQEAIGAREAIKYGWSHCWSCDSHKPDRANHCTECRRCILGQSDHWNFGANCIGYNNFRFYFNFWLWLSIGLVFANFICLDVLLSLQQKFTSKMAFSFFVPIVAWIFGLIDEDFISAAHSMFILSTVFYAAYRLWTLRQDLKNTDTKFGSNILSCTSALIPTTISTDFLHAV